MVKLIKPTKFRALQEEGICLFRVWRSSQNRISRNRGIDSRDNKIFGNKSKRTILTHIHGFDYLSVNRYVKIKIKPPII